MSDSIVAKTKFYAVRYDFVFRAGTKELITVKPHKDTWTEDERRLCDIISADAPNAGATSITVNGVAIQIVPERIVIEPVFDKEKPVWRTSS